MLCTAAGFTTGSDVPWFQPSNHTFPPNVTHYHDWKTQIFLAHLLCAGARRGALGPRDGEGLLLLLRPRVLGQHSGRKGDQQQGQLHL